ncbi:MAG: DedA family protein [Planctomycetota bacterium]
MLELIVEKASYLGFIAFLALCGLGLPVPEEAPLVLAGVLSSNGSLEHPTWAFGACLLGALLGDSVMYFIGRRLGHGYLMKHPHFARFVDPEREEKFEHIVTRHGFKLVLVTRFLVGLRGPVYFAAGAARVPYWRFLLWDLFAATIVVSVVFGLGYYYGEQIAKWVRMAELAATLVVVAGVALVGFLLYGRLQKRMHAALEHLADEVEEEEAAEANAEPPRVDHKSGASDAAAVANDGSAADGSASDRAGAKPDATGDGGINGQTARTTMPDANAAAAKQQA